MRRLRRSLLTLVCLGLTALAVALGTFGAFTATTSNGGNRIATGNVAIADDDAGAVLYDVTNAKPGDTVTRCIRVTYTGSLEAAVRIYAAGVTGPLAPYIELEVAAGTQPAGAFPGCAGFSTTGPPLFSGTLGGFATAHDDWATGLAAPPPAGPGWTSGDAVVFRLTATVRDDQAASGRTTDPHTFVFEARNR